LFKYLPVLGKGNLDWVLKITKNIGLLKDKIKKWILDYELKDKIKKFETRKTYIYIEYSKRDMTRNFILCHLKRIVKTVMPFQLNASYLFYKQAKLLTYGYVCKLFHEHSACIYV
jgi:hypothetical protein